MDFKKTPIVAVVVAAVGGFAVAHLTQTDSAPTEPAAASLSQEEVSAGAESNELPAALASLNIAGATVEKRFDTGITGVDGLVVHAPGQEPNMAYAAGIGANEHVLIGMILAPDGSNLTEEHAKEYLDLDLAAQQPPGQPSRGQQGQQGPDPQSVLDKLAEAPGVITTGNGPVQMFVTMDPSCPHCARMLQASKAAEDAVTFHWIPVAMIAPRSLEQAAAILAAKDPATAMDDPDAVTQDPSEAEFDTVRQNTQVVRDAGLQGTPSGVWVSGDGEVNTLRGAMTAEQMRSLR